MENDTQKLENYTFMESYHDAARELIKNNDFNLYGRFMFALNEYVLYGNEPDEASFDSVERLAWKLIKPIATKSRTNGVNRKKYIIESKSNSNGIQIENKSNSNRIQIENKSNSNRIQIESKSNKTDRIGKDKDKDNIKETNVSSCSNEHAAADAGKEEIDFSKFLQYFNDTMKQNNAVINPITRITNKRKGTLKARLREYSKKDIETVVMNAARSDFLNGGGARGFIASFDWIFAPSNFQKILEGTYNNERNQKRNKAHGDLDKNVNQIWDKYETEHEANFD